MGMEIYGVEVHMGLEVFLIVVLKRLQYAERVPCYFYDMSN